MKRLKMPKIPTRIPVPDMPSIRIRSHKKAAGTSAADAVPPVAAEQTQESKLLEQPLATEAKEARHRKANMPKIPLPSLSKPSLRKPSVPKIPLPSLSKPGAPRLSVPKIPMPSISLPSRSKKSPPREDQPQLEMIEKAATATSLPEPAAAGAEVPLQAEKKAKTKGGIHKISMPKMPSLHKAKEKQPAEEPATPHMAERKAETVETPPATTGEKKPKGGISGIHMPAMPSFRKPKEKPETAAETAPASRLEAPSAPIEGPSAQTETPKAKGGISGIHMPAMPSFRKPKEKTETASETAPAPRLEETSTSIEGPSAQTETPKAKGGISGIHMPAMPSFRKPKGKTETASETAPAPRLEAPSAPPEAPKAKGKSKMSMPRMPKLGMPSMSMGKGGTKATGKRILALSIEGNYIRLLSYHNNAVESWKSVPFNANLLKMGQVADPVGLGEAIKSAVAGIETGRCFVLCALPGLRSVSRIIAVPNVSKKEMDSVIPREVRRTMTVSEEDNYFHWQVLPVEAAQARVFVLAVPKEPLSLLLQALSHAGLNPAKVDLKPLALMRAINQKDAIIANCEGNSMELVIVSNDIPVLIRSVFLGEGVANQDYAVGRISDELGRTIVTYNEINKESPLDQDTPVYLTGAAAAGVPFALNVAALTGRTVQPLEVPITVPDDLPIAEYMVNIGLILKVV